MHVMIDQPRRLKTGRIKLTMFTPILWHTLVSKQESFQLNLSWYFHNPWTMNGKDMKQSCTKLGSWSIVRFLAWWARLVARNNESSSLWPAGFSKQNHLENWLKFFQNLITFIINHKQNDILMQKLIYQESNRFIWVLSFRQCTARHTSKLRRLESTNAFQTMITHQTTTFKINLLPICCPNPLKMKLSPPVWFEIHGNLPLLFVGRSCHGWYGWHGAQMKAMVKVAQQKTWRQVQAAC